MPRTSHSADETKSKSSGEAGEGARTRSKAKREPAAPVEVAPPRREARDQREAAPEPRPSREDRTERAPEPVRDQPREQRESRDDGRDQSGGDNRGQGGPQQGNQQQGGNWNGPRPQRPDWQQNQGGGQGGGGGDYGDGGGYQQGYGAMDRGFRRRKKRRRGMGMSGPMGPGGPGMGGGGGGFRRPFDPSLPSDDELEREAIELERAIANADPKSLKDHVSVNQLQEMSIQELHKLAEKEGFTDYHATPKQDLIFKILKARAARQGLLIGEGTLEIMPDGFGFLRSAEQSYLHGPDDIYVSGTLIRRYGLRRGMVVKGFIRPPKDNARNFALLRVDQVNGQDPRAIGRLVNFEDLTPLHPEKRYVLETAPDEIECRIVDLVAPIGFGQRALIVAPPRTGKTVLLQKMTKAISKNFPKAKIIVLLVDERPEEVTDFRRNCHGPNIEVVASTFDEQTSRHVQVAEMVIEKAKRMVEFGEHVVIFLDSITRLARAYNAETTHSGRIMTGGLDANALQRPKKFFGAARAIEGGGSLTIVGTALVDTGSKMDEVIFEEFKGTGNSELHLDRKLMDKRIYPCIDVAASGTRREELLLDPKELELVYRLRKVLSDMNVVEAMELLKTKLKKVKTNAEFLMTMSLG